MKKAKLLAGVLAASMTLLGTGYAYWSDQLKVTATVSTGNLEVNYVTNSVTTSTGELNETKGEVKIPQGGEGFLELTPAEWDVKLDGEKPWKDDITASHGEANSSFGKIVWHGNVFGKRSDCAVCTPRHKSKYRKGNVTPGQGAGTGEEVIATSTTAKGAKKQVGYINGGPNTATAKATATAKGVEIFMKNFYPGSFASVTFTAKNDGTIPAVIDKVVSAPSMKGLENQMQVVAVIGDSTKIDDKLLAPANRKPLSQIADVLNTLYKNNNLYQNTKLEPGETIQTTLVFILPGTVTAFESTKTATIEEKFVLDIDWIQHNQLTTKQKTPATTPPPAGVTAEPAEPAEPPVQ